MIENWIIPCNIKRFDVIEYLRTNNTVLWKNSFTIKKDDNAYIYIGAPYSEIRYRCTVEADNISDEILRNNAYAKEKSPSNNYFSKSKKEKYVLLRPIMEYPSGLLPLNKLKEHGLGQVQIQARTDRSLQQFIDEVDASILCNKNVGDKNA